MSPETAPLDVFRSVPLLAAVPEGVRTEAARLLTSRECRAGQLLVTEGEPGDAMYIILEGQAAVYAGGRVLLGRLGPGEVVGERALLTGEPRTANVVAETDLRLLGLDASAFADLVRQVPEVRAYVEGIVQARNDGKRGPVFRNEAYTLRALSSADSVIRIGRHADNDIVLEDPTVSAHHAELRNTPVGFRLVDLGSAGGTYCNRAPVRETAIEDGDEIWIGGTRLFLLDGVLKEFRPSRGVRLEARNLSVSRSGRHILQGVDVPVAPGELVAIIGASGAGKTTLLHAMLGLVAPEEGTVTFDSLPLQRHQAAFRKVLGYVPQEDILHGELTVEDALRTAGRLRLPPDMSARELGERLDQVLEQLGLVEQRRQRIDSLSGGERKRASIGVELLTDPRLILLDEPTSGLDPRTDLQTMRVLRGLADEGRTVVLTTHAVTDIEGCDRVVAVAGGRVAFIGSPLEALDYFEVERFVEVYDILASFEPETLAGRFAASEAYRRNVGTRLLPPGAGATRSDGHDRAPGGAPGPFLGDAMHQLRLLTGREVRVMLADRGLLTVRIAAAPVLALILLLLFHQKVFGLTIEDGGDVASAITLLYIVGLLALFLGAAIDAAPEITKERAIFRRERLVGVRPSAYTLAKVVVLGGLALVQSVLLVGGLALVIELPSPAAQVFVLLVGGVFLTTLAGIGLGLLVSAVSPNPAWALSLAVILLIPQIFFAGTIPRSEMNQAARLVSDATMSKWSLELLGEITDLDQRVEQQRVACVQLVDTMICTKDPQHPLARYKDAFGNGMPLRWGVLAGMASAFFGLTIVVQTSKGRGSRRHALRFATGAMALGALLVAVGSFLTWGEAKIPIFGEYSVGGMDSGREGKVTLALALAILAVAGSLSWGPLKAVRALAAGALGAAVLIVAFKDARDLQDIGTFVDFVTFGLVETSIGPGLLLVFAGGAAALVSGLTTAALLASQAKPAGRTAA